MNNNINIAELLKDCPKGTKLYSTIFGEVGLKEVKDNGRSVCIFVTNFYGREEMFYPDGKYNAHYSDSECTLFPSKEQRDWNKFQRPFKDGNVIYVKTRMFKWVSVFKKETEYKIVTYADYNLDTNNFHGADNYDEMTLCQTNVILEKRLATEEEKQKLFQAIKDNGYRWNADTKTLEKEEKEDKFDISTLKPFDKVLMRDFDTQEWFISLFSHYNGLKMYKYSCINGRGYAQCIPYEHNEHLLGTTNNCDEYYKTWKDETDE